MKKVAIISLILILLLPIVLHIIFSSENNPIAFAKYSSGSFGSSNDDSRGPHRVAVLPGDSGTENNNRSDFTKLYYRNLKAGYFGYNQYNTCGYVAIGMLLSYYDTFYNDNFIPEKFDKTVNLVNFEAENYVKSPGTVERTVMSEDFDDYIRYENNIYFNSHLLNICMNLGYYETKDGKISFNETHFSYLYDVLKEYFAYNYAINQYQSRIICENHEFDYKENVPNKDYTYS